MTGRRIALAAAGLAAAAALLLVGVLGGGGSARGRPAAPRLPASVQATQLRDLGLTDLRKARETGDPSFYTRAETALDRALDRTPRDPIAISGLGSLALSRHRFDEALRLGRHAAALAPQAAAPLAVRGDALLELGRYDAAFRLYDRLGTVKPGLSAYARIAHARALLGRTRPAVAAFGRAIESALGQGEPEAWTRVQLAKVLFSAGRTDAAGRQLEAALEAFPRYPLALDGLALVRWAQGDREAAIRLERQASDRIPLPQYVAQLGDMLAATGDRRGAADQYALMGAIQRLLVANGVRTDLETALYRADHRIAPAETVAMARRAQRERPSIDGDDVLGWALRQAGRCREALPYARRALRLHTRDGLKRFHLASVLDCLGRRAAARRRAHAALAVNPAFSVRWAPVARRIGVR